MSTLEELYQLECLIQHEFEQATDEEAKQTYADGLNDIRLEIWALEQEELENHIDRQGADQ
jgi:hypothetical protein